MYRFLISLAAALTIAFGGLAATVAQVTINGEPVKKTISAITFNGDRVTVHFGDTDSMDADMDGIQLSYVDDATSSVVNFTSGIDVFTYEGLVGDNIIVSGLQDNCKVAIFDMAGKVVYGPVASQIRMEINVSAFPQGVYVLAAGKDVVKFTKH